MLWWKVFYRSLPFPGSAVQPKKHAQVLLGVIFSVECLWESNQFQLVHARVVVFRVDVPPGHRVLPLALCFVVNFGVAVDDRTEFEFVLWSGGFQFIGRALFRQHGVGSGCVACLAPATHCWLVECVVQVGCAWQKCRTCVAVLDLFKTSMYATKCFFV